MKRNNSFSIFAAAAFCVAFYISGIPLAGAGTPLWKFIAAGASTAATASILHLTNLRFGSKPGFFLPPIYIVLASANPNALVFNVLHPVALTLALSLFFGMRFFRCDLHQGDAFIAQMFLGLAGCFFPPALWLAPLYFIASLFRADDTARFFVASLAGLLLPVAAWTAVSYLLGGVQQAEDFLVSVGSGAVAIGPKSIYYSAATIIRMLAVFVLTVVAIVNLRKTVLIVFITGVCLVSLLFFDNSSEPMCLLTSLAAALPLSNFLYGNTSPRRRIFVALILFLLIAERLTF